MSTDCILIDDELKIVEVSSKLSLVTNKGCYWGILIEDAPPEELMKLFIKGIKICSYWMDSETFKETLETLEDWSL